MSFVDRLSNEDVARIITVGVMWRELQDQADVLQKQRGDAIRAQLPLLKRQAEAKARLASFDAPEPPKSPFGLPPLGNPLLPPAPAGKAAAPGVAVPKGLHLLDPGTDAAIKARARQAAEMAAEASDGAVDAAEARIKTLQKARDDLLADGLESAVFLKRRAQTERYILPKVITYWPHIARALKGGFNPATAMQDDVRLLANALGTLAAEVGVLFAPVNEGQSYGTAQGFAHAKQKYGSTSRDLRPFGAYDGRKDLGNAAFAPRYIPELGMSIDDQFLIQDLFSDGRKFRGRGFVQMTGRAKYEKASKHLAETFQDCDLIADPDLANDAQFAAEIFADELKTLEKRLLIALKKGDLIAARSWVNAGNGTNRNPNGAREYAGAWRATLVVFFEKIERKELAPDETKRLLEQCEETDQAMREAEAKGAGAP
jgi:hypothetical protein